MAISFFQILKGLLIQNDTDRSKQVSVEVSNSATTGTKTTIQVVQTADRTISLPDADGSLMTASSVDTLTNKTYDADGTGNVLTNIDDANIKAAAAIDATKIANGSVSNTEYQFLDGVTSNIQTQLNSKLGALSGLTDNHIIRADGTTQIQDSAVTLSDAGAISGASIDADTNTITNIENADIKAGAAIDRTKLASGTASHVLINNGSGVMSSEATLAKSRGGSGQDNSSVNFPASGTLATLAGTEQLTNKDIDGGTASNTNRITLPQNTTANLAALTRKEGTIAYDTTLNELVFDDGSNFQPVSGGSTPTGDANTLAYFDGSGNLNSDNTDLTYDQDAIFYGSATGSTSTSFINHNLVIATAIGIAPTTDDSLDVLNHSILLADVDLGGKGISRDQSIAHGNVDGSNSVIYADGQSHAHGSVINAAQGRIEATGQSHAHGSVDVTTDGRILAYNTSVSFGEVNDEGFWIEAQNQSLAGGRTNTDGGVYVSHASIGFGEDINTGVGSRGEFNYQFGQGHKSEAPHITKFGRYSEDVAGDGSTWVDTDPLLVLGNGTSVASRANAYRIDKDGREIATASQVRTAIRTIVAASAIDARTDHKIICDTAGASGNLTLPPGEDGLEYIFTGAGVGGASYTLIPDGAETLDASVVSVIGTTVISRIYFSGSTWYGM